MVAEFEARPAFDAPKFKQRSQITVKSNLTKRNYHL